MGPYDQMSDEQINQMVQQKLGGSSLQPLPASSKSLSASPPSFDSLSDDQLNQMVKKKQAQVDPTSMPGFANSVVTKQETPSDVSWKDRLVVENLSNSPFASMQYLQERYPEYDIKHDNNQILMSKKGSNQWNALSPKLDITSPSNVAGAVADNAVPFAQGLASQAAADSTGAAIGLTPAAPLALPAAAAVGAGTNAGLEALKTKIGSYLGLPQELNKSDLGWAAAGGALSPLLFGTGGSAANIAEKAAAKGLTQDAAQAAVNFQKGLLPTIAAPVTGFMTGTPAATVATAYGRMPELKQMEKEGVTALASSAADSLKGKLSQATQDVGQKIGSALRDSGQQIDISGAKNAIQNRIAQLEAVYGKAPTPATKAELDQAKNTFEFLLTQQAPSSDFSGSLKLAHGSPRELTQFNSLSDVPNDVRYDGGNGIFGKNTYFDQNGQWVAKDGKYASGGRGINADNVYGADVPFNKALIVSPSTLGEASKILDGVTASQAPEHLNKLGYDGLIVHGMDDHLNTLESKFTAQNPHPLGSDLMGDALASASRKWGDARNQFLKNKTGLTGADDWQDQIVSLAPEKAQILQKFSNPTLKNIRDFASPNDGIKGVIKSSALPDQMDPLVAMNLLQQLKEHAGLLKQASIGSKDARPVATKMLQGAANSAYQDLSDQIEQVLSENGAEGLRSQYGNLKDLQRTILPLFDDPSKTYNTLRTMGSKNKKVLFESLQGLDQNLGTNLVDDAKLIDAYSTYSSPKFYTGGTPLALAGAGAGFVAGNQESGGHGYAGPALGTIIGAGLGKFAGSPGATRYLTLNAARAAQKVLPQALPSAWDALMSRFEQNNMNPERNPSP